MAIKFCPHCGEDVQMLTDAGVASPAAAALEPGASKMAVVKREVTSKEIENLWGNLPLPFHIIPFGVVVDAAQTPLALACHDNDGGRWALARGETRMLGDVGIPELPGAAQDSPSLAQPMTVPDHLCNSDNANARADRGQARYGKQ